MDPRWEAFFYGVAIALWFIGAVKPLNEAARLSPMQCALLGWASFAFPFLWNAVSAIE